MNWEERCIPALLNQKVFLSPQHFSRFETAFAFLRHQQFFTRGVCKYAVLATWDQNYFDFFSKTIHEMAENKDTNSDRLIAIMNKYANDPDSNRRLIIQLGKDFLTKPGVTPSETLILKLSKAWIPIVDSAITASLILDEL
jgi:hypothetical protein